jgi:hypothetical protein
LASIIPPVGLAPGSEYQLIFSSADTTLATNANISYYNAFVTNEAALNPSLPAAAWTDVGSTATVNAVDNAPNIMVGDSYLPVYNTQGILVSDNASGGLYAGTVLAPIGFDQFGDAVVGGSNPNVDDYTGSSPTGMALSTQALGETAVGPYVGRATTTTGQWLEYGYPADEYLQSFGLYGLSSPLTVPTPEPATITLLGTALSLLAGFRLLKRRRMARQIA